jgi:hypothetical protein
MKKLYVVAISMEIVVVANSAKEAEEIATSGIDDTPDYSAVPMTWFPYGWEPDSIVYGNVDVEEVDRTLGEWIDRGAAPEYVALQKKLGPDPR